MTENPDPALVERIAGNLAAIEERIAAAGRAGVTVVGVTKRHPVDVVVAAVEAGVVDLGENYAQELVGKAAATGDRGIRWHFIGQLQRNKVRSLAPHVSVFHTIDRSSIAAEVGRRCPGVRAFVQVDLAGIPGRGGCAWADLEAVVGAAKDAAIDVVGLMGVAPPPDGPGGRAEVRACFEHLARANAELGFHELSIGMTADLDEALGAGATVVRIGTGLFGERTL